MKVMKIFDRIIDLMAYLAGVLLVGAVLIVSFEICMRYFVQRPQVWTVEVCEYILFGLAFLGAPWLLKKGGHVSVDILAERVSPKTREGLGMFSTAIGVFISAIVCWFGLVTARECYLTGVVVTKTLTVSKHYFLILISIGYLLLLIEFGRQFLQHLKNLKGEN